MSLNLGADEEDEDEDDDDEDTKVEDDEDDDIEVDDEDDIGVEDDEDDTGVEDEEDDDIEVKDEVDNDVEDEEDVDIGVEDEVNAGLMPVSDPVTIESLDTLLVDVPRGLALEVTLVEFRFADPLSSDFWKSFPSDSVLTAGVETGVGTGGDTAGIIPDIR